AINRRHLPMQYGPPSSGDQPQSYAGQIANTIWDAINPFPPAEAHESEAPGNIAAALRARVAAGKLSEEEAARIESQFSGLERWNKDAVAARAQIDANTVTFPTAFPTSC